MKKISLIDYSEFEHEYWLTDCIERFGQAFMNKFNYGSQDFEYNLFYEPNAQKARDFILQNLIEFPQ